MKKILACFALALVFTMILSSSTMAVEGMKMYELSEYGQVTYKIGNATTTPPTADAVIGEKEYSKSFELPYGFYCDFDSNLQATPTDDYAWLKSDSIKLHVSYDDNYIYLGIEDKMANYSLDKYQERNNYWFIFGFVLDNYQYYFQMKGYQEFTSMDEAEVTANIGGLPNMRVDKISDEDLITAEHPVKSGSVSVKVNPSAEDPATNQRVIEFALDKSKVLALVNEHLDANYKELPNAFYFSMRCRPNSNNDVRDKKYTGMWGATALNPEQQAEIGTGFTYVPSVIVLGDEIVLPVLNENNAEDTTTDTLVPESTENAEATTNVAETTKEVDTTKKAETADEKKGGCSSTVAGTGIVLGIVAGLSGVFASKKRKKIDHIC